jgi:8-oxo-dGTP pyrophosphatase MutT (NUDIX family)
VEASSFEALLRESLEIWQSEERTGIWILVPVAKAMLVPVATSLGFDFHHAKPGTVALIKWLPDSSCMIPRWPFTNVGVGAVIFNRTMDQLLAVQEKHGPLRGKGVWKIPTGMIEPGEPIGSAAEREVWEETGIKATFDRVLLFRHRHPSPTSNCDLFFVCALKLEGDQEDQEIKVDESELEAAKFLGLKDYLNQPCWRANNSQGTIYREHINRVIELYRKGSYQGLETEAGAGHTIYTSTTRKNVHPIIRPIRRGINFIRRLARIPI